MFFWVNSVVDFRVLFDGEKEKEKPMLTLMLTFGCWPKERLAFTTEVCIAPRTGNSQRGISAVQWQASQSNGETRKRKLTRQEKPLIY